MIRHCVFVKFRSDVDAAGREEAYRDLRALVGKLDGLIDGHFGGNVSPEGAGRGYTGGFTMDFVDAAARDAYLIDPDHRAAGKKLVSYLETVDDRVFVFDLEL